MFGCAGESKFRLLNTCFSQNRRSGFESAAAAMSDVINVQSKDNSQQDMLLKTSLRQTTIVNNQHVQPTDSENERIEGKETTKNTHTFYTILNLSLF